MRQKTLLLLAALISAGCNPLAGNTPAFDSTIRGSDPLAGLSFKPVSQSTAQRLDGSSASGATAPAVCPAPAIAPDMACSMPYYNYGSYGFNEQMSLVSLFEAEAAGYAGSSFQEMMGTLINPVIRDWSSDARLVSTYGAIEGDSTTWNLSYMSKTRSESLDFTVGKTKTSIIRKAWGPLMIQPEKIAVDSTAALKSLQDAIMNQNAKSEEDRTGKDYFFGTPLSSANQGSQMEVLYRLPANARWNISLQSILGHTVWQIDGYASNPPAPSPTPSTAATNATSVSICDYAHGMIDAETGALIRLSRPYQYTYTNGGTEIVPPAKAIPL